MEDTLDKKSDSVFSVVGELCSHYAEKNALAPSDKSTLKKQYFQAAYECLLHKRCIIKEEDASTTCQENLLELTLCEVLSAIQVHHSGRWAEVKSFVLPLIHKLDGMQFNSSEEEIIVSLLKMILLIHQYSPKRDVGMQVLSKCYFIRPRSEFIFDWQKRLKSSQSNYFFPTVPTRIKNDPAIRRLFFTDRSASHPVLSKLKKSVSWNERMSEFIEGHRPRPALAHTSQILDEGYVTPNDDHREVTPEPAKNPSVKSRKDFSDYFTWDVIKEPPIKYYSWDTAGCNLEERWKHRGMNFRHTNGQNRTDSYKDSISTLSFLQDVSGLLVGLESSSFILKNGAFVMSKNAIYVDSKPIFAEDCQDILKCGTYFSLLHNFIMRGYTLLNSSVMRAICHTLHYHLYNYETTIGKPESRGLQVLIDCALKPMRQLHFMCQKIGLLEGDNNEFSCQVFLDKLYISLYEIRDQDLLSLTLYILYKCTDAYVLQFETLIRSGETSYDLGTDNWDLSKVPSFLGNIKNTISNSVRSLYLLHKYGRILRLRHEKRPKVSSVEVDYHAEVEKSLKEHLAKFLKDQQEKHAAIAKVKQEKLQEILDDIASKKMWKEKETQKMLEQDKKMAKSYEKIDQIKETLLEEVKAELISKCEALNQEKEKFMILTEWKTKRLKLSFERDGLLVKEKDEDIKFRRKCQDEGIDLKKANAHLLVEHVKVKSSLPLDEVDGEDETYYYSRSEDGRLNKLKSTVSSNEWKFDPSSDPFGKVGITYDKNAALDEYKSNKLRAQATKETVMSSDLTRILGNQFDQSNSGSYKGLSEEEMKILQQSLSDLTELKNHEPGFNATGVLRKRLPRKTHEKCEVEMPTYAGFRSHLSSCHLRLKEEMKVANQSVLEMLRDDFLDSVNALREYFLLENCNWSWHLSKELVDVMCCHSGFGYIKLNRLLPAGFSTIITARDSARNLDPTQPSCLNYLSLSYTPPRPIDYLLIDKVMEGYQAIFNFLKQLECGSLMLKNIFNKLKVKGFKQKGNHLKQIEFYHHVMNHFMLSLRSFIYSNIEVAWSLFKADANKAKSIDELFKIHCSFLNNVSMLCCLKRKVHSLLEYLNKVLRSIFLFCEIARCSQWSINAEGFMENSKVSEMSFTYETFLGQTKILCNYLRKLLDAGFDGSIVNLQHFIGLNNFYILATDERSYADSTFMSLKDASSFYLRDA